jgi:tyrosine-protein kinase Etk/Wzc
MPLETQYPELKESPGLAAPAPPAARDNRISVLDLLIALASRKRSILITPAVCAVLAIAISFVLPVRFTATAVILTPQQNNSLSSLLTSQLSNLSSLSSLAGGSLGLKNQNDMYIAMLKSQTVEDGMVQDFNLRGEYRKKFVSDAVKTLEGRSEISGKGEDGLIRISVRDPNPDRAAQLANGWVVEFRKLSAGLAITEASQRRMFFEKELEEAKDNLANAEEALKQTEETTGLIQVDSQARALIASAAGLRAQVDAKEVEIQAMRTYATGENAQLMQAQQELDSLRGELAKLGGSEENADSLIVPKGKVPEAGLEYVRKLRDVKYYETVFDILARQFELAKLDEAKEGALIQVVDPALRPDRRSFPKRGLLVICTTLAGFLLGILIAIIEILFANLEADPETSAKLSLLRKLLRNRRSPAEA